MLLPQPRRAPLPNGPNGSAFPPHAHAHTRTLRAPRPEALRRAPQRPGQGRVRPQVPLLHLSHAGRRGADRPSSRCPLLPATTRPRSHRAPLHSPAGAAASSPTWCRPPPRARPDRRPMRSLRRLADGTRRARPLVGAERPCAPSANRGGGRSATCGRPMAREEENAGINPVLPAAGSAVRKCGCA